MIKYNTSFWSDVTNRINIANRIQNDPKNDLHDLELLLKRHFPESAVKLFFFGSRFLGVGQESSDFDVYVDIDNCFNEFFPKNSLKLQKRVARIRDAIASDSNWNLIELLGNSCIRAANIPVNLQYDINLDNGATYSQNKLIKYMFELQPIARYMVVYLRSWAQKHKISDQFRSHILVLLVVYFLQVSNLLPGIQHLQKNLLPTIGPFVVTFNQLKLSTFGMSQIMVTESEARKMINSFFEYYAKFMFSSYAICPYLGCNVATSTLGIKMPNSFTNRYFCRDAIVIQDMFNFNCNKGKNIKSYDVMNFKALCASSTV